MERGFGDGMDCGRWREGLEMRWVVGDEERMDHGRWRLEGGFVDEMWTVGDEYCLGQGSGDGDKILPPVPFHSQVSPEFKAELT